MLHKERQTLIDLLIDIKTLKPDFQKFEGNPAPALAEKLILIINKMTPYSYLFEDDFKIKIKEFILTYQAALKGDPKGENIFKLIKPTTEMIEETLKHKIK